MHAWSALASPPAAKAIVYRSLQIFFLAWQGLSIQARDGARREALEAIVDHALTVWDTLAGAPMP